MNPNDIDEAHANSMALIEMIDDEGYTCSWCGLPVEDDGDTCDIQCYTSFAYALIAHSTVLADHERPPKTLRQQPWYEVEGKWK